DSYNGSEGYERLAKSAADADGIRITVIALDGTVLADTAADAGGSEGLEGLENHSDRKEVKEAIDGAGVGRDIRKSESFGTEYLYTAKLVDLGDGERIVLRAATEIRAVNSYVYGVLFAAGLVSVALFIVASALSGAIARAAVRPLTLIKNGLDRALSDGRKQPIKPTKYGEINAALKEIDEISGKLKDNMSDYRKERQKLDFIIENIDQGVITLSHDKRINSFNRLAGIYFGIPQDGGDFVESYITDPVFNENLDDFFQAGTAKTFDITLDNGRILEIRLIPIKPSDVAAIIAASDVTDKRKLAAEKQEFFLNASHELNTPLSSVLGYSELMLINGKYEKGFVETINKEAERMKSLISDMLLISGLEGRKTIEDGAMNIRQIAERVIVSYTPKARAKNITLKGELSDGIIFANGEMITELIANLVDNAVKYNYDGGTVLVKTECKDGAVILIVKDDGIGIPQKYQSRVFERFFRVDKGRSRGEGGTGLGLAIVKHIAGRYNAALTLESAEGAGTAVRAAFKSEAV
ncbi:MAG: hypothetical protein LBP79_07670, partial [Clostridiales bacterium]|nr:hypothetical protein [Clostridiales bacterium]